MEKNGKEVPNSPGSQTLRKLRMLLPRLSRESSPAVTLLNPLTGATLLHAASLS
jgi:hypothetical protein